MVFENRHWLHIALLDVTLVPCLECLKLGWRGVFDEQIKVFAVKFRVLVFGHVSFGLDYPFETEVVRAVFNQPIISPVEYAEVNVLLAKLGELDAFLEHPSLPLVENDPLSIRILFLLPLHFGLYLC